MMAFEIREDISLFTILFCQDEEVFNSGYRFSELLSLASRR